MVHEQIMGNKFKYKSRRRSKLRRVIILLLIVYFVIANKDSSKWQKLWGLQHGSFEICWFFQVKGPTRLQAHNSNIKLWLKSLQGINYNLLKDFPIVISHVSFRHQLTFVSLVLMVGSWIVNLILVILFAITWTSYFLMKNEKFIINIQALLHYFMVYKSLDLDKVYYLHFCPKN
jgi:hypothetical protein